MTVAVVSGFAPIPDHPRPMSEYSQLGTRLLNIKHSVVFAEDELKNCWLYEYLTENFPPEYKITHSIADNPKKNSLAYHIVQAQKTEWLEAATHIEPAADVFVWIDFGIFHLPGVTEKIIDDFLDRAENERAIAIPGCWPKDYHYDDDRPCWRFCGGVMVVPRRFVVPFNTAMQFEYVTWLKETGNISWEVNTLARLEKNDPGFPVWHYKADHDRSMFTNYRATLQ